MAQLADNNALLIYRIGPVLCCAPTLPIETLIPPPALTRPPGSSASQPGIFRHDGKLVRLTNLRQLFGVETQDRSQPGQIIICQLNDRYIGLLVDDVIDVITTPANGWGALSASLSGGVFSKSLLLEGRIHLYTEFEKLLQVRHTGFLKPWIEHLHKKEKASLKEHAQPRNVASATTLAQQQSIDSSPLPAEAMATTATHTAIPASSDSHTKSTAKQIPAPPSNDSLTDNKTEQPKTSRTASQACNNTDDSQVILPHKLHEPVNQQKQTSTDSHVRAEKTFINNRAPASSQTATLTPPHATTHADSARSTPTANRISAKKAPADKAIGFPRKPARASALPLTPCSDNPRDVIQSTTTISADKKFSGWFMFSLILISLGLVTAFTYLWLDQAIPPDKISTGKIPTISVTAEKPVLTMPEIEEQNIAPPPTADRLSNPAPSSQLGTTDITSETVPRDKTALLSVIQNPLTQHTEGAYHAAIEPRSKEPGNNEITIILSAPASDKVIRSEADLTQREPAASEATADTHSSTNDTTIAPPTQQIVHTVVRGDTLWHIAQRYIHNPYRYPELARLNKIRNPDLIYPGDRVRIIRIYQKRSPTPATK